MTVQTAIGALVACSFAVLFDLARATPLAYRRPARLSVEAFLGVLVAAGLFVSANNLTAIVFGESLFRAASRRIGRTDYERQ